MTSLCASGLALGLTRAGGGGTGGGGGEPGHAPCRAVRLQPQGGLEGTVPPMPPGAFVKGEGVVPPMPPDAFVKVEVVVKEEEGSDDQPKRQRAM